MAPDAEGDDEAADQALARARGQRRGYGSSHGFMGGILSRYGYTALMALAYFYFTSRDSRGSGFGNGRGTYYLFWLVGPALAAIFLEHPAFLGIVAVGLVARPWLPDPLLYLRYLARTRKLEGEIRVNRANVTARRDLSLIWLEKRRAKRALPLIEEALALDPGSLQLLHLRGVCLLQLRRYEEAVHCFVTVVQRDARHGFGEPYLRAADALIALGRWDDAEEALEHFVLENRSSVEGQYKRALVARGRGDRPAFKQGLREARNLYRDVPRYQQRRQFSWYVRALFSSALG
ncbi:MAG TPA: tetratricopeptide repeat protein [Polyangiaceae bacterium]